MRGAGKVGPDRRSKVPGKPGEDDAANPFQRRPGGGQRQDAPDTAARRCPPRNPCSDGSCRRQHRTEAENIERDHPCETAGQDADGQRDPEPGDERRAGYPAGPAPAGQPDAQLAGCNCAQRDAEQTGDNQEVFDEIAGDVDDHRQTEPIEARREITDAEQPSGGQRRAEAVYRLQPPEQKPEADEQQRQEMQRRLREGAKGAGADQQKGGPPADRRGRPVGIEARRFRSAARLGQRGFAG